MYKLHWIRIWRWRSSLTLGKADFLYQALKRVISISIQNFLEQWQRVSSTISTNWAWPERFTRWLIDGIAKQDQLAFLKPIGLSKYLCYSSSKKLHKNMGLRRFQTWKSRRTAQGRIHSEFNDREDGNKGLQSVYGWISMWQPWASSSLPSHPVRWHSITDAYSTDAEIARYDLVVWRMISSSSSIPRRSTDGSSQETSRIWKQLLNKLAGKITESQIGQQLSSINQNKPAEQVAKEFLQEQGLLKK